MLKDWYTEEVAKPADENRVKLAEKSYNIESLFI